MAAVRTLLEVVLVLLLAGVVYATGAAGFANSYISPKSASELQEQPQPPHAEADSTSAPALHPRVERSADPILVRSYDDLARYKHLESPEDNGVDGHSTHIQPSRTMKDGDVLYFAGTHLQQPQEMSGEGAGAPQARQLVEPHIDTTSAIAPPPPTASSGRPRQSNPDIQDIITGIVKLLNGNVNVQANTSPSNGGRPLRPLSTRINNRGPPRITDVPALPPDFDVPSPPLPPPPPVNQQPPPATGVPLRAPSPYPFDLPPPFRPSVSTKRPALYRPVTIPPWSRPPYRRPFPPRRPTPIPTYKPNLDTADTVSLTSERPGEDILTLDLGSEMIASFEETHSKGNETHADDASGEEDFEKSKEKSTSKMEKHSHTISQDATINATDTFSTSATSMEVSTVTEIVPSRTQSVYSTQLTLNEDSNKTVEFDKETTLTVNIEPSTLELMLKENSSLATEILPQSTTSLLINSNHTSSISSTISSTLTNSTTIETSTEPLGAQNESLPYHPYRPRPGIVLDDTEYKPGGVYRPAILTARPAIGQLGEIFDVTVSAIQGPGGSSGQGHGKPYVIPVDIDNIHASSRPGQPHGDVITSPMGSEGFVSIDGKRTYLNLFGEQSTAPATAHISPTHTQPTIKATGYAEVDSTKIDSGQPNGLKPTPRRPLYGKRPTQPPVRIDTCIVGDDTTCDGSQYEVCLTEAGVSSCHCRPGYARRKHREPCRKVVSLLISLRVDRLYDRRVQWSPDLTNKAADAYQQLSYEAERALDSAMSMTPFSDEFLGSSVNSVYEGDRSQGQAGVFVNLTLQVEENAETSRANVKGDIQRHLLGVIQRRSNNIGNSALWVDSPPGSVSTLQDVDECYAPELNDCHQWARCVNTFGGFKCACLEGYRDPWSDSKHRAGRQCEQCSPAHCNNRGECKYEGSGQEVCVCSGNYYGAQCELDGEVLGVAIGASVAAVIIIGLTLVCLVMWSRRWNREQKAAMGSPVFGYMATASNSVKTPVVGGPPYQMTLEDRLRWAQIADAMAQTNHYAPEPVTSTRPSSALFGYPSLPHAASMHGTLPPIPLPRLSIPASLAGRAASIHGMRPLDNSSSSEEEDKADLLGRNFHVPRPKSRSNASVANQSGIYYDVDYEQNEIYKHPSGNIPMSTYTAGRHPFYRN